MNYVWQKTQYTRYIAKKEPPSVQYTYDYFLKELQSRLQPGYEAARKQITI